MDVVIAISRKAANLHYVNTLLANKFLCKVEKQLLPNIVVICLHMYAYMCTSWIQTAVIIWFDILMLLIKPKPENHAKAKNYSAR